MSTIATYMKTGSGSPNRGAQMDQFIMDFSVVNVTQNDIHKIFQCPEDYIVIEAGYEILISGTASATLDLGKAGGTELLSGIALDAAVGTKGAGSAANPVFFSDSDTIDAQVAGATAILGKVRVWWVGCDVTELNTVNDFALTS